MVLRRKIIRLSFAIATLPATVFAGGVTPFAYTADGTNNGEIISSTPNGGPLVGKRPQWNLAAADSLTVKAGSTVRPDSGQIAVHIPLSNDLSKANDPNNNPNDNNIVSLNGCSFFASSDNINPAVSVDDGACMVLNINNAAIRNTANSGTATSNPSVLANSSSNSSSLGNVVYINMFNGAIIFGSVLMSPYTSGYIALNDSSRADCSNGPGLQLGQGVSGTINNNVNYFSLYLYGTGNYAGPISVATGNVGLLPNRNTYIWTGPGASSSFTSTVTNVNNINLQAGSSLTTGGAITGLDNALRIGDSSNSSATTFHINHNISGNGAVSFNNGTAEIRNGATVSMPGYWGNANGTVNVGLDGTACQVNAGILEPGSLCSIGSNSTVTVKFFNNVYPYNYPYFKTNVTNSGTLNVYGAFHPFTINNNAGTYNLETGSFMESNASFPGSGSAIFNIGNATKASINSGYTITNPAQFNVGNTNASAGSLYIANAAITGISNSVNVGDGSSLILNAQMSGTTAAVSTNKGSIAINSNGSMSLSGGMNIYGTSYISIDGSGSFSTALTGTTDGSHPTNTTALLFGTNSPVNTSITQTVTSVPTVTIANGSSQMTIGAAVTNVNSAFSNSGTTQLQAQLDGTGSFNNYGSITLNVNGSITRFPSISMGSGSSLSFNPNASKSISGTWAVTGQGSNYGTLSFSNSTNGQTTTITQTAAISKLAALNIATSGAGSALFTTSSTIDSVGAINIGSSSTAGANGSLTTSSTISNVTTLTIGNASDATGSRGVLTLNDPGGRAISLSNIGNLVVNGQLNLSQGAIFSMGTGQQITGTNTNALITNSGQLSIGGNINFAGGLSNTSNGIISVSGTPTLTFSGTQFNNQGNIFIAFSPINSISKIFITNPAASVTLAGPFTVTYNHDYIASGNYDVLSSAANFAPGALFAPSPSRYISAWSLNKYNPNQLPQNPSSNYVLVITVTRDGFDKHALTQQAALIGAYLEQIGSSGNASATEVQLLNAFEKIDNDADLTSALLSLLPPNYHGLVSKRTIDAMHGAVDVRIAEVQTMINTGVAAGDVTHDISMWARPFHFSGKQSQKQGLDPYTESTHGWVLGLDRVMSDNLLLGAAISVAGSNVIDGLDPSTAIKISTYQLIVYGTLQTSKDIYLDGLLSGGTSNYHSGRTINIPGFLNIANGNYSSQQLTAKIRVSKFIPIMNFFQLIPEASASYTYQRFTGYSESGVGNFGTINNPHNENLLRLGVGSGLGIPFTTNKILSIPSVYAKLFVDAKGGNQDVTTGFIGGGSTIITTVQPSKLLIKLGASYEVKFSDNFEMVANYDYVVRRKFHGQEMYLNARYTF